MLACKVCFLEYNISENRPVVGSCGHTYCFSCSKRFEGICPTCRKYSFTQPPTNYDLLEQVQKSPNDAPGQTCCCRLNYEVRLKQLEKKFEDSLGDVLGQMESMKATIRAFQAENRSLKTIVETVEVELAIMKSKNMDKSPVRNTEETPDIIKVIDKLCWHCRSILPKSVREDGVSVTCPDCKYSNLVGDLKEGNKWVWISRCSDYHFIQIPEGNQQGTEAMCTTCKKVGSIWDRNNYQAK